MKKIIMISLMLFCIFNLFGCNIVIDEEFNEKNDVNNEYGEIIDEEINKEYVVNIVDGEIIDGKDAIDSFYNKTKNGEKLKIIINYSYTESESKYSNCIIFDGIDYIIREENDPVESKFKYLNYSETDGFGDHIIKTESYCLSNDKDMTYEKIINSWFSSILDDIIDDSIAIYRYNYYIDLCFKNNKVLNIKYNDREYPVNSFNKSTAREIVDGLSWSKDIKEEVENSNWDLRITMNRTILNDGANLLLEKKGSTVLVEYLFNFEKKIAVMDYLNVSSLSGRLYATLSDQDIEETNNLFSIFQGQSGTNWGEYLSFYDDKEVVFEINENNKGKIYVKGTDIVETIDSIVISGDGKLYLTTNNGRNTYAFIAKKENKGGYTYTYEQSTPSSLIRQYLNPNMFFKWIGYPCS